MVALVVLLRSNDRLITIVFGELQRLAGVILGVLLGDVNWGRRFRPVEFLVAGQVLHVALVVHVDLLVGVRDVAGGDVQTVPEARSGHQRLEGAIFSSHLQQQGGDSCTVGRSKGRARGGTLMRIMRRRRQPASVERRLLLTLTW